MIRVEAACGVLVISRAWWLVKVQYGSFFLSVRSMGRKKKISPTLWSLKYLLDLVYCIPNHRTQVQPTVPAGRQLAAHCRINWYQYDGL